MMESILKSHAEVKGIVAGFVPRELAIERIALMIFQGKTQPGHGMAVMAEFNSQGSGGIEIPSVILDVPEMRRDIGLPG